MTCLNTAKYSDYEVVSVCIHSVLLRRLVTVVLKK